MGAGPARLKAAALGGAREAGGGGGFGRARPRLLPFIGVAQGKPPAAAWTPGRVRHGHWPRPGSRPEWALAGWRVGPGRRETGRAFGLGPLR
jgi:hypothetical protein